MSWYLSLSKRCFFNSPLNFTLIPLLTLASLVFLLIAFLLPLKILILFGSTEIPAYFPAFLNNYEHKQLVFALTGAAGGLYVLHIVFDKLKSWMISREAKRLILTSNKIVLFANQDKIIQNLYLHYSVSMAGMVFILLSMAVVSLLYGSIVLVVVFYLLAVMTVLGLVCTLSVKVGRWVKNNLAGIVNVFGGIGFFLVFAFMIYDFFQGSAPSVLITIITLLLIRQILTQTKSITKSLLALFSQRDVVSVLLFQEHQASSAVYASDNNLLAFSKAEDRDQLIAAALKHFLGYEPGAFNSKWLQSGVADIFCFNVTLEQVSHDQSKHYLIKFFDPKRSMLAQNESKILSSMDKMPAPKLLSVFQLDHFYCHIFEPFSGQKPQDVDRKRWSVELLEELMLGYTPTKELELQYKRSHLLLWQRLNTRLIKHLQTTAEDLDDELVQQVDWFAKHNDGICLRLQALPLTIVNTVINRDTLIRTESEQLVATHWGDWRLEPMGAGWPVEPAYLALLDNALTRMQKERDDTPAIEDVRLAAVLYALESFCQRQNYVSAIEQISLVRQYFDNSTHSLNKD